jgi:integrase/recombinase XerD
LPGAFQLLVFADLHALLHPLRVVIPMVQKIVKKWADYSRLGDLSPHNLRRTAITRALESGLSYRRVQMMSKHRDPKTVMRYDYGRENLDQNAVNFLGYDEE